MANNEFSKTVPLLKAVKADKPFTFQATKQECAAIAKRAGLPAIKSFSVTGGLAKGPEGGFLFKGQIKADFLQVCSKSGEEFEDTLEEGFETVFFLAETAQGVDIETLEEIEDYEVLKGEDADIGEVAVQYFLLSLDPFPILKGDIPKKGVTSGVTVLSEEEHLKDKSPFSVLENLKKKS